MRKIHFIAIGGSAMHNLAIALHKKGIQVTGSDDEVFEPSRSRLAQYGLLPSEMGWNPENVSTDLDGVILGMHARPENPELKKAREIGIPVFSYPEYLYEQTKNKRRVVIAGSHGKTTITSMLLHVLKKLGRKFDFMVGAQIKGFDTMVGLSDDAEVAIFEGDEYLSSPIDPRPKFLWYKPHIALISGIAWDHINVFPTENEYNHQFKLFIESIPGNGSLVYYAKDEVLNDLVAELEGVEIIPYDVLPSKSENGKTMVQCNEKVFELALFGKHNMQNLAGAYEVAKKLDITKEDYLEAMTSFKGADRRLQEIGHNDKAAVFFDFAHAPSKVKATVGAVKEQFPRRRLMAALELHTFSSLNRDFLPQYKDSLSAADEAVVFFSPDVVAHKHLPEITEADVKAAFHYPGLKVFTNPVEFRNYLSSSHLDYSNLLIMSSGNLVGMDVYALSEKLLAKD